MRRFIIGALVFAAPAFAQGRQANKTNATPPPKTKAEAYMAKTYVLYITCRALGSTALIGREMRGEAVWKARVKELSDCGDSLHATIVGDFVPARDALLGVAQTAFKDYYVYIATARTEVTSLAPYIVPPDGAKLYDAATKRILTQIELRMNRVKAELP